LHFYSQAGIFGPERRQLKIACPADVHILGLVGMRLTKFMDEQTESQTEPTESEAAEKPFLLQHLIIHGVLASVLLMGGWLVPAQYNILHPKVLHQAGVQTQTFKEFCEKTEDADTQTLLNLARLRIESTKLDDDSLPHPEFTSALRDLMDPQARFHEKSRLLAHGGASSNLVEMIPQAPEYGTALILIAKLQAEGKATPAIYESLLEHDKRKYSKKADQDFHLGKMKQILHTLLILGNRLSYPQLAELTADIPDPHTLLQLAKIAKHQTMVPAFSLFDTDPKTIGYLTQAELEGRTAIGEDRLFKIYSDQNQTGISKGTITRDEWVHIGHVPLEYTDFPTTYAACVWSGQPDAVANYLMTHGRRGDRDLQKAINEGRGALVEMLETQLPVSGLNTPALGTVASFCYKHPRWALAVKYLMLGLGCFVLMRAWSGFFVVTSSDRDLLRAYRMRRRAMAFAMFLTLTAISEPVLFTPAYASEYQLPINLPEAVSDSTQTLEPTETMLAASSSTGTVLSIIFIVIFAAIQAFVYFACVSKIKSVMNDAGDAKLKLRLLENEDNLFDMGLYVGIAGTALMLAILIIFDELNVSVSAAYASNIFGILCVAVVKIVHVRSARQQLIIESRETPTETQTV